MFPQFGVHTFADSQRGTGHERPTTCSPTEFNDNQRAEVAKQAGISHIILSTKHHDDLCLWPYNCTNHLNSKLPWRNNNRNVVGDLITPAKVHGINIILYFLGKILGSEWI